MKRFAFVSAFAILAALAVGSSTAHAQADHLKCFKAKDSAKFNATATLSALQAQFGVDESCEIKGKGKLFCVPVTKQVTAFEDNSKDGIAQVPITGQVLEDDRVCYKVKCPKTEIASEVVTDQFGARTMEKFKVDLLCTPAIKGAPATTTTTTTLPVSNDPCQASVTPGCPGCVCESEVCAVDPYCCDTLGAWDDFCVQECEATGDVTCPPRAPYCQETSAPTCGGDCSWAPGTTCTDLGSGFCWPSSDPCTVNADCAGEPLVQECITCLCN